VDDEDQQQYLGYQPMRPELLSWEELKLQANFAVKCYKDSVYRGQLDEQHRRCGLGVITYSSGRAFEGSWDNDKRHGPGFERFQAGNTFEGEYHKGKVHGQGRYSWKSGEYYDG